MYDAYLQRIAECDQALEQHLKGVADKVADTRSETEPQPPARETRRAGPKRLREPLRRETPSFAVGSPEQTLNQCAVDVQRWSP